MVAETRNAIMSAVQMLNPRAMLMRRKQALQVNVNAARGLQEVLKTNLGIISVAIRALSNPKTSQSI